MKKNLKLILPAIVFLPNLFISTSANKTKNDVDPDDIHNFDKKDLKETDYENAFSMYEEAFKPMAIMQLRKWMLENNMTEYSKENIAILDDGHVNFDAIIKPKNSKVEYKYYPDGKIKKYSKHATTVASLIGGVSGINPYANLYSLGSGSGNIIKFRKKIDWAIKNNVKIFNFSIGADMEVIDKYYLIKDETNSWKLLWNLIKIKRELDDFDFDNRAKLMDEYSRKYKVIFVKSMGNDRFSYLLLKKELEKAKQRFKRNKIIQKYTNKIIEKIQNRQYFLTRGLSQSINSIQVASLNTDKKISYFSSGSDRVLEPTKAFISAIGRFNAKWKQKEKTKYYYSFFKKLKHEEYETELLGTSFASPIIAGITSLITSIYSNKIPWTIDAADIKNILALNSIYAKNTYEDSSVFWDTMIKDKGTLAKQYSGFGLPNWIQIKEYLTNKNKHNKWILLKNNEYDSKFVNDESKKIDIEKINKYFYVNHNARFKASMSWLDSPRKWSPWWNNGNNFYNRSSNYNFSLNHKLKNSSISYSSDLWYGNHEMIHRIHKSPNKRKSKLELEINYIKDTLDHRTERELKIYFKEYNE